MLKFHIGLKSTLLILTGLLSLPALADSELKVQIVENYIAALNTGNVNTIESMYAENATVEDPVGGQLIDGHAAIVSFYADGAFQNELSAELTGPVRVAGNSVAFSLNVYFGDTKIEVIDVFELDENNKVTSLKAYWSPANMSPVKQ